MQQLIAGTHALPLQPLVRRPLPVRIALELRPESDAGSSSVTPGPRARGHGQGARTASPRITVERCTHSQAVRLCWAEAANAGTHLATHDDDLGQLGPERGHCSVIPDVSHCRGQFHEVADESDDAVEPHDSCRQGRCVTM